ncbi:IclR family transcriptional regulator [Pseudonocardia sp. TRM90224]|uniref:IclR family transcriptional regulator n=1 Tax=Pseudonocardia sp. TRM90224 TaxID=2812678 RepID=UPI001E4D81C2|nr:IclR family transcriptional regulator [Pseudonocardia sp. TRM90224]
MSAPSMLGRAVSILAAFTPGRATLGVSELARRTGLAKSTVHRLAGELVQEGLLEPVEGGFRLGMRLFELGHLVPGQRTLRERAAPVLGELRERSGQTVHLAVLDGTDVLYLDVLPSRSGPPLPSRMGGRMPAHATGVGKALLAHTKRSAVETVVAGGLKRLTPRTIAAPGLLHAELARVAARGVAFDGEESAVGLVCAASPVHDRDGAVIAAISVSGRSGRLAFNRVAPQVHAAARTLTGALQ